MNDLGKRARTLRRRYNLAAAVAFVVVFFLTSWTMCMIASGTPCPPGVDCPSVLVPADKVQLKSPYVRVVAGGNQGSGTVVHVEDGTAWVVTASHVVGRSSKATVFWFRGGQATGEVVGTDPAADIAVFQVTASPGSTSLRVLEEDAKLEPGTPIELMGYPGGKFRKIKGRFIQHVRYGRSVAGSILDTSGGVARGTSGGSQVVETNDGKRLAGVIATSDRDSTQGASHVYIRKLLKLTAPQCLGRRRPKPTPEPDVEPPIVEIPDKPAETPSPPAVPTPKSEPPYWLLLAGAIAWIPIGIFGAWTEFRKTQRT